MNQMRVEYRETTDPVSQLRVNTTLAVGRLLSVLDQLPPSDKKMQASARLAEARLWVELAIDDMAARDGAVAS